MLLPLSLEGAYYLFFLIPQLDWLVTARSVNDRSPIGRCSGIYLINVTFKITKRYHFLRGPQYTLDNDPRYNLRTCASVCDTYIILYS